MLGETEAWEVDRDLCKVIHQPNTQIRYMLYSHIWLLKLQC